MPGYSYTAERQVDFEVDFLYANAGRINWRERLVCPLTGLSNRLRASIHLADSEPGMLTQVRAAGFAEAYALTYWSDAVAYLGVEQIVFFAFK